MPRTRKKRTFPHDGIAKAFHGYVCGLAASVRESAQDRDGAHRAFVAFYQALSGQVPPRRLEALVMTRLRQWNLLKSKRYQDRVLMMFADLQGAFPTGLERVTARERFLQQKKDLESDKHGLSLTLHKDEVQQTIELGATATFHFFVEYNNEDDDDPKREIELESIILQGSHRHLFKFPEIPFAVPWLIHEDPVTRGFVVTFTPRHISVFRCCVQCNFTLKTSPTDRLSFSIAKYISTKGTVNVALEKALAPVTPYVRKKRKDRSKGVVEVVEPEPEEDGPNGTRKARNGPSFNPFEKLPPYKISTETRQLLDAGQLDTILQRPGQSDSDSDAIQGYASFWENLLWANEFQAHVDVELFDLEQVPLKQEGNFFLLDVPGLAESRPSVLLGDSVRIYWNKKMYFAKVNQVRLLEVRLKIHSKFKTNFNTSVDRVDVRFCVSRTTFRTCHHGVVQAETSMKCCMLLPRKILVDEAPKERSISQNQVKWANRTLNPEQQAAVLNVLKGAARPLPYCIFGPPGTGKTTTVIETIYQLAKICQSKILLVAPSNDAADILVERLAAYFPPSELKRILAYSRTIETVPPAIREYVVEGVEPRLGGPQSKKEHGQCKDIKDGRIVVATVNMAARFSWMGIPCGHFDVLCVDEAGHATEPEVVSVASTLINFVGGSENPSNTGQLILAGDPRQLGPVVTSEICRRYGLEVSYMERLMKSDVYERNENEELPATVATKLIRNYRSHPAIMKLPNEMFYDGELKCEADKFVSHSLCNWEHLPTKNFPILFHSIDGENQREGNSPSWFNPQEVVQVVEYVKLLTRDTRPPLKADDIGIITPYHRQAQKIRMALDIEALPNIKVGSVETFKGQERRCIIVSTVRADVEHVGSDLRYNLGFVANEKRFNVAITRAKAMLIVVGCPIVLALDKDNWLPFLRYCYKEKAWVGGDWDPDEAGSDSLLNHDAAQEAAEEGFVLINREE